MKAIINGIDISYYDNILDWPRYDWSFAFIKVSESVYIDIDFKEQWRQAKGHTYRGAYHFFRASTSPKLAVQKMIEFMDGDFGELPIVMDLEASNGYPGSDVAKKAIEWIEEYRRQAQKIPIVYSSPSFLKYITAENYPYFADYKLWLAIYPYDNYPVTQRETIIKSVIDNVTELALPATPKPFTRLAFIQWTGKGLPPLVAGYPQGYKLAVDFNVYNGNTIEQMKDEFYLADLSNGETPMPTPEPILYYADLQAGYDSNVRASPTQSSAVVKIITGPLTVSIISEKTTAEGYNWYKISVPAVGYIALTSRYTNFRPVSTVPANKTIVKSTILFDDGSTQDLYPTA